MRQITTSVNLSSLKHTPYVLIQALDSINKKIGNSVSCLISSNLQNNETLTQRCPDRKVFSIRKPKIFWFQGDKSGLIRLISLISKNLQENSFAIFYELLEWLLVKASLFSEAERPRVYITNSDKRLYLEVKFVRNNVCENIIIKCILKINITGNCSE